jgi:hypothetical protein
MNTIQNDLVARGFMCGDNGKMEYAMGSIAHYKKCRVYLGHRHWGDMAGEWFYLVRYESFAESGQPEFDHHIISETYVAASKIADFMCSKGILSKAEIEDRRAKLRERIKRG